MQVYVVWMDSKHAKVYRIQGEKFEVTTAAANTPDHHTHSKSEDKHKDDHRYFAAIVDLLGHSADRILLVGPGNAKTHFKTHLEDHHNKELAKRVVGTETMDHPTDAQLVAHAHKYFASGLV